MTVREAKAKAVPRGEVRIRHRDQCRFEWLPYRAVYQAETLAANALPIPPLPHGSCFSEAMASERKRNSLVSLPNRTKF